MTTRDKLNQLKEKHRISTAKLADLSGVASGTISTFLSGHSNTIGFDNMVKICDALGESLDWFAHTDDVFAEYDKAAPAPVPAPTPASAEPRVVIAHMDAEMDRIAGDALERVLTSQAFRTMHINVKWWRGIAISLMAVFVLWFAWDVTHPHMGLIQYTAMLHPTSGSVGDLFGRVAGWFRSLFA